MPLQNTSDHGHLKPLLYACALGLLLALCSTQVEAQEESEVPPAATAPNILIPQINSERGRKLFVDKACVVCHSINGIGGKAAPPLDAIEDKKHFDLMDFTARMWRGADVMIVLQNMELGYQIDLTGQEIADLAAFANDTNEQSKFSENDIPDLINEWMLEEPLEFDINDFTAP